MGEVVNLNRFRKDRLREEKRLQADANARRFGRTKAERGNETARAEKSARDLDQHQRDTGPEEPRQDG